MFKPSSIPPISFSLRDCRSDANPGATKLFHFDVFPDRIDLAPGVTMTDAVLGLFCMDFLPTATRVYNANADRRQGYDSPVGRIHTGAFLVSDHGTTRPSVIEVHDDHVLFPDGEAIPVARFGHPGFSENTAQERDNITQRAIGSIADNPEEMIALGAICALLPAGASDPAPPLRVATALGVIARLARINQRRGNEAVQQAVSNGTRSWRNLVSAWILEPDRCYAPRAIDAGTHLARIRAACDPVLLELGARVVGEVPQDITLHEQGLIVAMWKIRPGGPISAHRALALEAARRRIAERTEAHCPLNLLKHSARRRQEKCRNA